MRSKNFLVLCDPPLLLWRLYQPPCLILIVHNFSSNFFFHLQFLVNFFPIASFVSSHHIHFHYRWQKESFHSFHWVYIWMSSRSMIICFCLTVSLICQFTFCFYFTFNVMTLKLFAASITSIYYLLLLNAINSYSSFCSVRLIMFSSLSS